jgi:hypothetical protein
MADQGWYMPEQDPRQVRFKMEKMEPGVQTDLCRFTGARRVMSRQNVCMDVITQGNDWHNGDWKWNWKTHRWRRFMLRVFQNQHWGHLAAWIRMLKTPERRTIRALEGLKELHPPERSRRTVQHPDLPKSLIKLKKADLEDLLAKFRIEPPVGQKWSIDKMKDILYAIPRELPTIDGIHYVPPAAPRVNASTMYDKMKTEADRLVRETKPARASSSKGEVTIGSGSHLETMDIGKFKGMTFQEIILTQSQYSEWAMKEVASKRSASHPSLQKLAMLHYISSQEFSDEDGDISIQEFSDEDVPPSNKGSRP